VSGNAYKKTVFSVSNELEVKAVSIDVDNSQFYIST
jgi:hypothetical protein